MFVDFGVRYLIEEKKVRYGEVEIVRKILGAREREREERLISRELLI